MNTRRWSGTSENAAGDHVDESREPTAANRSAVKRDSLAIGFERAASKETEIERNIMRLVLRFRQQIPFRIEDFTAADRRMDLITARRSEAASTTQSAPELRRRVR
ncbi:MAG TPA: hypothetical protein VF452_17910 [Candidatus Binatia bacterium]